MNLRAARRPARFTALVAIALALVTTTSGCAASGSTVHETDDGHLVTVSNYDGTAFPLASIPERSDGARADACASRPRVGTSC